MIIIESQVRTKWSLREGCDGPHRSTAERSYRTSKEQRLRERAESSSPMLKVSRGSREEIPHVRGKRNPSKMVGVARGRQRADTVKP